MITDTNFNYKKTTFSLLCSLSLLFFSGYTSFAQKDNKSKENSNYSVAAYVWPSCHDEEMSREARNNDKMKFYIMWANHDVPGNMWNHYRYKTDSLLWQGEVDWDNFKIIVARVIKQYFSFITFK